MKRPSILVLLFIALLLSLVSACSLPKAANYLNDIKQDGVIKVGTSPDYPPFEFIDTNQNKAGFEVGLMTEIAKRLGVKLEWVDMPFDKLIASVQQGKPDMSISAFNYDEKQNEKIDFTKAYYTSGDSFMVKEGFTGKIEKPEDIVSYKFNERQARIPGFDLEGKRA